MSVQHFRKRLMLRAVLRQVTPMVIRLVSVSDHMQLAKFHDIFRAIRRLSSNGAEIYYSVLYAMFPLAILRDIRTGLFVPQATMGSTRGARQAGKYAATARQA